MAEPKYFFSDELLLGHGGSRWAISAGLAGLNYFFPTGTSSGRGGFIWAIFAGIAGLIILSCTHFWSQWAQATDLNRDCRTKIFFLRRTLTGSRWVPASDRCKDCRAKYFFRALSSGCGWARRVIIAKIAGLNIFSHALSSDRCGFCRGILAGSEELKKSPPRTTYFLVAVGPGQRSLQGLQD